MDGANPLLLSFLKEWYDQAKEHNSKGVSTYKRAYESMKACPIPFDHPSQCIELNGLGPKLCERLTRRMEQYCALNGLPMPKVVKGKNARKRNVVDDHDYNDDAPAQTQAPNPKRPRKTKEYIPTYRSGAYALLFALYEAGEDMLTKEQLIEMAQPHADTSFTAPSDPTKHYTAWGSMKTLIEKNLVYGRGRPKRYCLTDTGDEVARATVEARDPAPVGMSSRGVTRNGSAAVGEPGFKAPGRRTSANPTSMSRIFKENQAPRSLDDGDLPLSESDGEDFRRIARRVSVSRQQSGISSGSATDIVAQRNRLQTLYSGKPVEYGKGLPAPRERPPPPSINVEDLTNSSPSQPQLPVLRTLRRSSSNIQLAPPVSYIPSLSKPPYSFSGTHDSFVVHSQSQQPGPPSFPPFVPDVLKAGTFTVHLIIDNREVRTKNDRDYIQNNLSNAGVNAITRSLQVGDAMWIAREKGGMNREVVLDYIVERKRLDDLISSIKDGRFHDQKFRLKKSGIKNVVYIVEDFTIGTMDGPMQEAIETAISSTQVVNGFFVKKTNKLDDTIRYLVRMTKMLEENYKLQDLNLIPENLVDSRTYQALLTHLSATFPRKCFYTTYIIFSSLVSKSGALTLRDVFLKMMMCVRGVSIEKALEIQRNFRTPKELVEAYERCNKEAEKKDFIMKSCSGAVGRKKIGNALSSKISEVWAGVDFEDGR